MQMLLVPHFPILLFLLNATDVQDVVTADENLSKLTGKCTINVLFSVGKLEGTQNTYNIQCQQIK